MRLGIWGYKQAVDSSDYEVRIDPGKPQKWDNKFSESSAIKSEVWKVRRENNEPSEARNENQCLSCGIPDIPISKILLDGEQSGTLGICCDKNNDAVYGTEGTLYKPPTQTFEVVGEKATEKNRYFPLLNKLGSTDHIKGPKNDVAKKELNNFDRRDLPIIKSFNFS